MMRMLMRRRGVRRMRRLRRRRRRKRRRRIGEADAFCPEPAPPKYPLIAYSLDRSPESEGNHAGG
eukprot:2821250-Pyramimonas_sp.AAC.1